MEGGYAFEGISVFESTCMYIAMVILSQREDEGANRQVFILQFCFCAGEENEWMDGIMLSVERWANNEPGLGTGSEHSFIVSHCRFQDLSCLNGE